MNIEKPDVLSDEEIRHEVQAILDFGVNVDSKVLKLIQQAKAEVAGETRFQILEWFRNYAHQLDRKFPHPTTEEQGWLGNIWDMIHMAGKEDFESKYVEGK